MACILATPGLVRADVITDWNDKACVIVGKVGPGSTGHRIMAIVQVSVYDAVSSIDRRHKPYLAKIAAPTGASVEAAVAAANHAVLAELVPGEKSAIEAVYQSALAAIPDGQAKADGISVGEKAASAILARAAADGSNVPDTYQPRTTPGVYVPTTIPVFATWTQRKPWIMARPDQFRPGPPPELSSDTWVKDYNEVKALGGKNSSQRTPQQTEIARFWEETRPLIYHPLLRSVAIQSGRTVAQNARLYAAGAVAIDDALIAVYDAKYIYQFWRPITAIRNGGGNKATAQEIGWTPLIPTPMHPEYPCAHCISSSALAAVIQAEVGGGPMPVLATSSPTAGGLTHQWTNLSDLTEEVKMARIYDGVHYRNSADVGIAMGQRIGKLVVEKF
ncbi:MAG TPA: vanadium-dependent haloperoxidase [Methylibium sp.]